MTTLTTESMTADELRREAAKIGRGKWPRKNKYNARRTIVGNIAFHSKREAEAWQYLKARERAGEIRDLRRQVKFELLAWVPPALNECVCKYVADFVFWDVKRNREVVADAKGCVTALFRIKQKLMRANYGIEVELI